MAKTTVASANALTKKVWEEKLFRDTLYDTYFNKFMGNSDSSLVQVKTNLEKQKGDRITFGIRMQLTGDGVTEGQILEGNEEALTTYDYSLTLGQYRHAVRSNGELDAQRAMYDIYDEQKTALKEWGAQKIDSLAFAAILASPTKLFYPSGSGGDLTVAASEAAGKAALHATQSKLNPNFIVQLRTWAMTGGNGAYTPLRPVRVEGDEYFVLLTHPDSLADLKMNSTFQNAMRDARERGPSNPLFKGAVAIWDNVVIHEHRRCTAAADGGGASVAWNKAVFMGAQSLVWAWGQREKLVEKTFDYDNEKGVAWGIIAKTGKPVFNSKDYGSLGVYLSRTNISGQ